MGLSVDAVGGIGIIVDLRSVQDQDTQYELAGDLYRPQVAGELMVATIGDAEQGDRFYFIGHGAKSDWNDEIDGVPHPMPAHDVIRAEIKAFLASLPCKDGTWLTLYNERNFGFHIHTYTC